MKIKDNKGITITILVITITVMIIIAGIAVYSGKEIIKEANLESVKTDMLLIQAKARGYVEEANFKKGQGELTEEIKTGSLKGTETQAPSGVTVTGLVYSLSSDNLKEMGLNNIKDDTYLVVYNVDEVSVDVIIKSGFKYDGKTYYLLSDMLDIE